MMLNVGPSPHGDIQVSTMEIHWGYNGDIRSTTALACWFMIIFQILAEAVAIFVQINAKSKKN